MKPEENYIRNIEDLLSKCKKSYDIVKAKYPKDDLRPSMLAAAGNTLRSYHIFMCMTLDTVTETKWWITKFGSDKPDSNDLSALKNMDAMTKHAFLVFFLSRIEWSMRKFIIKVFPDKSDKASGSFKGIYDFLFEKLGIEKYTSLYDLCRTIRNTVHNNGHYINKSKTIEWNGRQFEFKYMEPIDFFDYPTAMELYGDLLDSIDLFINSSPISDLEYISDTDQTNKSAR